MNGQSNNRLDIQAFGGLTLTVQSTPVTGLNSRKVAALLVYVACAGKPQPREVMAEFLWEGRTQSRALGNLRVALTSLRQHVGDFVYITRETIGLSSQADTWLDIAEFDTLVQSDQLPQLERAVAHYQGDFLAGFYVNSQGFEDWVLLERERLRFAMMGALDRLIAACLANGDCTQGITYATRLLEQDPLREKTYRQLMRLLAHAEQRTAALAQYERCVQMLDDELGVPPAPETSSLAEQVRAGALSPAPVRTPVAPIEPAAAPLPGPASGSRSNLPRQATSFIGREEEIAHIHAQLAQPDCRLLTLVGPGGIGKSRLALAAAERLINAYQQGVYFVELAPLDAPEHLVQAVGAVLEFTFYQSEDSPRQQLLAYLAEKHVLLVLDNFEHLLDGVDLVDDILSNAPGVQIVATSREALRLDWEWLVDVRGMRYQAHGETSDQHSNGNQDYGAVLLFADRARRHNPDFSLREHRACVAQLCRLLQGMPLAIELAAAWMRALSCETLMDELTRSLDILETQQRNVPGRHRSMRAVFETSWARLNADEQQVFMRLSVFRGGFTQEAAQQVAGASLRTLLALINKSLLWRDATSERYTIHELLRQYAEQELSNTGDAEIVRDAHSNYFAAFLRACDEDIKGPRQLATLNMMDAELDNVRATWEWAVRRRDAGSVSAMLDILHRYFLLRGMYEEGKRQIKSATTAFEAPAAASLHPEQDDLVRGRLYLAAASFQHQSQYQVNRHQLEQSLAIFRQHGAQHELATALLQLGTLTRREFRDYAQALAHHEAALAIWRARGETWHCAKALIELSHDTRNEHHLQRAQGYLQEALQIYRQHEDQLGVAEALLWLGGIARVQQDYDAAMHMRQESHAILERFNDRRAMAINLEGIGNIAMNQGRYELAASYFQRSLDLYQQLGFGNMAGHLYVRLATVVARLGDAAQAADHATTGIARLEAEGVYTNLGIGYTMWGFQLFRQQDYPAACHYLDLALQLYRAHGTTHEIANALNNLGHVNALAGDEQQATTIFHEALTLAWDSEANTAYLLESVLGIAYLIGVAGEPERAAELLVLTRQHPDSPQALDELLDRYSTAIQEWLTPDKIAAASARGKTLDLETVVQEILAELC